MPAEPGLVDQLTAAVLNSKDYGQIDVGVIRKIGAQELERRKSLKDALKATKSRLHQVGGAYQPQPPPFDAWLEQLTNLPHDVHDPNVQHFVLEAMNWHASTRERLPWLQVFYDTLLRPLLPLNRLADLACGLNPLALAWMGLASDTTYAACDIYTGMLEFLRAFHDHVGQPFTGSICDLSDPNVSLPEADVILLLKTLPCLEHLDKGISERLLSRLQARHLIVTFPARSLGGRSKGMPAHYEQQFLPLATAQGWQTERHLIGNELCFLLTR